MNNPELQTSNEVSGNITSMPDTINPKHETMMVIIKPDGMPNKDAIIQRILHEGFKLLEEKTFQMSLDQATELYESQNDYSSIKELIKWVSSSDVCTLIVQKENAINDFIDLLGSKNSSKAKKKKPQSLRALFGKDRFYNAVDGSESLQDAKKEITLVFGQPSKSTSTTLDNSRNKIMNDSLPSPAASPIIEGSQSMELKSCDVSTVKENTAQDNSDNQQTTPVSVHISEPVQNPENSTSTNSYLQNNGSVILQHVFAAQVKKNEVTRGPSADVPVEQHEEKKQVRDFAVEQDKELLETITPGSFEEQKYTQAELKSADTVAEVSKITSVGQENLVEAKEPAQDKINGSIEFSQYNNVEILEESVQDDFSSVGNFVQQEDTNKVGYMHNDLSGAEKTEKQEDLSKVEKHENLTKEEPLQNEELSKEIPSLVQQENITSPEESIKEELSPIEENFEEPSEAEKTIDQEDLNTITQQNDLGEKEEFDQPDINTAEEHIKQELSDKQDFIQKVNESESSFQEHQNDKSKEGLVQKDMREMENFIQNETVKEEPSQEEEAKEDSVQENPDKIEEPASQKNLDELEENINVPTTNNSEAISSTVDISAECSKDRSENSSPEKLREAPLKKKDNSNSLTKTNSRIRQPMIKSSGKSPTNSTGAKRMEIRPIPAELLKDVKGTSRIAKLTPAKEPETKQSERRKSISIPKQSEKKITSASKQSEKKIKNPVKKTEEKKSISTENVAKKKSEKKSKNLPRVALLATQKPKTEATELETQPTEVKKKKKSSTKDFINRLTAPTLASINKKSEANSEVIPSAKPKRQSTSKVSPNDPIKKTAEVKS